MGHLTAYAFLALLLVVVAVVFYRALAKPDGSRLWKHFGLEPGESTRKIWVGQIDLTPSLAERVRAADAGALAGALLTGLDVGTTRAPGVVVLLTTLGRLLLLTERPDHTVNRVVFAAPAEVAIDRLGPGARRMQGGPSEMLELTPTDGAPLRILLHAQAGLELSAWNGRRANQ